MLAPRHLGYVDKALYTGLYLNECTIVGDDNNLAFHVVAHLQVRVESIPWVRSELLQTECYALLLVVEVKDNDVDLLVELNHLVGIVNAAPRQVCDVDESVYATKVDEYAVGGDVLDSSLEDLTLLQLRDNLLLLGLKLCFDEGLVGNYDVAELLVDFHNLEFHGLANELIVVAYGVNVNLASRQECLDTEHVNNHATLSAALDVTLNDFLIVECSVDTLPALAQAGLLV